ncbi:hypothetical protein LTR17_017288 [Elasticomyces elasticus]|nr:hypothetical protein LTR17_017288 [Elasticomyces elasticus]
MASTIDEKPPSADDLAITLQQILSCAHRVAPGFRKLLDEQARGFLLSVKPFRLLDLPRELRDAIYSYATVVDEHLLLSGPCMHEDRITAVQPAITRVNRQARQEALPIFYSDNTFEAHITDSDFGFFISHMQIIGIQSLSLIQHITFSSTAGVFVHPPSCAASMFEIVRWLVTTRGAEGIDFMRGPPRESEALIYGAISLALDIRQQGKASEDAMRLAFGEWLRTKVSACHCGRDDGGWGDGSYCVNRKELFTRYRPTSCELRDTKYAQEGQGWGGN